MMGPGISRLCCANCISCSLFDALSEFKVVKGLDVREEVGVFQESSLFYGAKGMWVLNVPQGRFALAWNGTEALILDQGTHVLNMPNLKSVSERDLVDQSSDYIKHGNAHLLRVPPGKIAKIVLNNQPFILESRQEPYVFKNALFTFDPATDFVDAGDAYIRNGSLHILQVCCTSISLV
jgi:hypothetical protein